eukprot:jgi/Bigna1/91133/estExt_fgenesh1_pg.C_890057
MDTNTAICSDPVTLGRVVIGLYGNVAPDSVTNFQKLAALKVGGYKGSVFQEIHRGEYILAGRQGRVNYNNNNNNNNNNNIAKPPRPTLAANATHKKHYNEQVKKGYIDPLWRPSSNKDITNPKALALRSQGPGTVSVLFQGGLTDDDEETFFYLCCCSLASGIGSIFSISTTSKVSQELEEKSLVVGRVLEGMEVISQIDQIPTFRPSGTFTQLPTNSLSMKPVMYEVIKVPNHAYSRERSFNLIGGALGDQRAARKSRYMLSPK